MQLKLLLTLILLLWVPCLFAKEEKAPWAEASYTGATSYAGFALGGGIPLSDEKDWTGTLQYGHVHLSLPEESTSNEFILGLEHEIDETNTIESKFTYWNDTVNKVDYLGPSFSYTYNWLEKSEKETSEDKKSILSLTLSSDLFFYSADIAVDASGTPVHHGKGVVGKTTTLTTTEFQPGLELEKPLFDETVSPYVFVSHAFYTKSPSNIEVTANRNSLKFISVPFTGVNWMVGGFLKNTWELGVTFHLVSNTSILANYGGLQSAVDNTWATIYGITLTQPFGEHLKVKAAWDRDIQPGLALNYYTGGLVYLF